MLIKEPHFSEASGLSASEAVQTTNVFPPPRPPGSGAVAFDGAESDLPPERINNVLCYDYDLRESAACGKEKGGWKKNVFVNR